MSKKIIYGFLLVLGWLGIIIGASSGNYYKLLSNNIIPNYERYGDLYRFTNLPQFKLATPECFRKYYGKDTTQKQNIALYSIGDSFLETWRINEHDFDFKQYKTIHWFQNDIEVVLDSNKTNVLLIECVERHSRDRFGNVPPNYKVVKYFGEGAVYVSGRKVWLMNKWTEIKKMFFTSETNDHLEHVFFSSDWILPLKELKASFNLNVFDRINPSAGISKDRKHIFYYMDTDSTLTSSSYNYVSDAEIAKMVSNMDSTVKAYKKAGFDHVIVNIIPNKASILAANDGQYNHLLERWEAKVQGKFPIVSVYNEYTQLNDKAFGINETHWSCEGKNLWLKNVQEKIKEQMTQAL